MPLVVTFNGPVRLGLPYYCVLRVLHEIDNDVNERSTDSQGTN